MALALRSKPTPPPVSEHIRFADFFSLDDFRRFADHALLRDDTAAWRNGYQALQQDTMKPTIQAFLLALQAEGKLSPITGAEGHRITFVSCWNKLVAGDLPPQAPGVRSWEWQEIVSPFEHGKLFDATYHLKQAIEDGGDPEAVIPAFYAQYTAEMDGGNFPAWSSMKELYCFVDDNRYQLDVAGWQLTVGNGDRDKLNPIQPIAVPQVVELTIDFATPDLLIADWFRIDAFTKAVNGDDKDAPSINSSAGIEAATTRYVNDFGFISVFVGNRSPEVLALDGTLTFGSVDDDAGFDDEGNEVPLEDLDVVGRTSTQLWWVTVIERARLVDIIAATTGPEEAERQVAAFLAEDNYGLVQAKVEPGQYHLYFHPEHGAFAEQFRSPDLAIPKQVEPMFVLSPRPLRRENAAEPEPAAANPGPR